MKEGYTMFNKQLARKSFLDPNKTQFNSNQKPGMLGRTSYTPSKDIAPSSDTLFYQLTSKKSQTKQQFLPQETLKSKPKKFDEFIKDYNPYINLENGSNNQISKRNNNDYYNYQSKNPGFLGTMNPIKGDFLSNINPQQTLNQQDTREFYSNNTNNTNNPQNLHTGLFSAVKPNQQSLNNQNTLLDMQKPSSLTGYVKDGKKESKVNRKSKTEEAFDKYNKAFLAKLNTDSLHQLSFLMRIEEQEIDLIYNLGIMNYKSIVKVAMQKSDFINHTTYNYPDSILSILLSDQQNSKTRLIGYLQELNWVYFAIDTNLILWNYTSSEFASLRLSEFDSPIVDIALLKPRQDAFTIEEKAKFVLVVLTQRTLSLYLVVEEDYKRNGKFEFKQKQEPNNTNESVNNNNNNNNNSNNNNNNTLSKSRLSSAPMDFNFTLNNYLEGHFIVTTPYILDVSDLICTCLQVSGENRIFVGCANNLVFEVTYGIEVYKYFGVYREIKKHKVYSESYFLKLLPSFLGLRKNFLCKKIVIDDTRHLMYCLLHRVEAKEDILNLNNAISSKVLVYDLSYDGKGKPILISEIEQNEIKRLLKDLYQHKNEFTGVFDIESNLIFVEAFSVPRSESNNLSLVVVTRCGFRLLVEFFYQEVQFLMDLEKWLMLDRTSILSYKKPSNYNASSAFGAYSSSSMHLLNDPEINALDGFVGRLIKYNRFTPVMISIKEDNSNVLFEGRLSPYLLKPKKTTTHDSSKKLLESTSLQDGTQQSNLQQINSIQQQQQNNNNNNNNNLEDEQVLSNNYFYFNRKLFMVSREDILGKSRLLVFEPSVNYKNESILMRLNEKDSAGQKQENLANYLVGKQQIQAMQQSKHPQTSSIKRQGSYPSSYPYNLGSLPGLINQKIFYQQSTFNNQNSNSALGVVDLAKTYKNHFLRKHNDLYSNFHSPLIETVRELACFDITTHVFEIFKLRPRAIFPEWRENGHLLSRFASHYTGKNNCCNLKSNFNMEDNTILLESTQNTSSSSSVSSASAALSTHFSSVNCLPGLHSTQYFFYGEELLVFTSQGISIFMQQRPIDELFDILIAFEKISLSFKADVSAQGSFISGLLQRLVLLNKQQINLPSSTSVNNLLQNQFNTVNNNINQGLNLNINPSKTRRESASYIKIQDNSNQKNNQSLFGESPGKALGSSNLIGLERDQSKLDAELLLAQQNLISFIMEHGLCETSYMLACIVFSVNYYCIYFEDKSASEASYIVNQGLPESHSQENLDSPPFNNQPHQHFHSKDRPLFMRLSKIEKSYPTKDTLEIGYQLLVNLAVIVFSKFLGAAFTSLTENISGSSNQSLVNNVNISNLQSKLYYNHPEEKDDTFAPIRNSTDLESTSQVNCNRLNYISYGLFEFVSRVLRFFLEDAVFKPVELESSNQGDSSDSSYENYNNNNSSNDPGKIHLSIVNLNSNTTSTLSLDMSSGSLDKGNKSQGQVLNSNQAKPKIRKTLKSTLEQCELESIMRILNDFKQQLLERKDRLISDALFNYTAQAPGSTFDTTNFQQTSNSTKDTTIPQFNNNNNFNDSAKPGSATGFKNPKSALLYHEFCFLNVENLQKNIDEVVFLIDQTIESLNLINMIASTEEFKLRFSSQIPASEQIRILSISFKNLIYRKENPVNVKFLLDEYFQALISNCSDPKQFSRTLDLLYSQCPSFFSKKDKEVIYNYFILNEHNLLAQQKHSGVQLSSGNFTGLESSSKVLLDQQDAFIGSRTNSSDPRTSSSASLLFNLSAINNDDDGELTSETEALKNAVNVICQNPLSMRLDILLQALSRLKAVRYIVKVCVKKASALHSILDVHLKRNISALDAFSVSSNPVVPSAFNPQVLPSSAYLDPCLNPQFSSLSALEDDLDSNDLSNLTLQDIESIKQQFTFSIRVLLKLLEEIDFRIANTKQHSIEEMNLIIKNSPNFPQQITPLFEGFIQREDQLKHSDGSSVFSSVIDKYKSSSTLINTNDNSKQSTLKETGIRVSQKQMTQLLIQWKKVVIEEILSSNNKHIHNALFLYLAKENQIKETLSIESSFLEEHLKEKYSQIPSIENLTYLYKYYLTGKKDLNLTLNYLVKLIFEKNDDSINLNSQKLSLDERKNLTSEYLMLLEKLNEHANKGMVISTEEDSREALSSVSRTNPNTLKSTLPTNSSSYSAVASTSISALNPEISKQIVASFIEFKPQIQYIQDCLNLQSELVIYLQRLLEINPLEDTKLIIEEEIACLNTKVYELTDILRICSAYHAFKCAIRAIHFFTKNNFDLDVEAIKQLHLAYIDTLVNNNNSSTNLHESLVYYLSVVFDINFPAIYKVKSFSTIVDCYYFSTAFNINNVRNPGDLGVENPEALCRLLDSVFPLDLMILEFEKINSNAYPIDKHCFDFKQVSSSLSGSAQGVEPKKHFFIHSLKDMLDMDFKSNFNCFWFASYLIDSLNVRVFFGFEKYLALKKNTNKNHLPHFILVLCFFIYRFTKQVEEYLKYFNLSGLQIKQFVGSSSKGGEESSEILRLKDDFSTFIHRREDIRNFFSETSNEINLDYCTLFYENKSEILKFIGYIENYFEKMNNTLIEKKNNEIGYSRPGSRVPVSGGLGVWNNNNNNNNQGTNNYNAVSNKTGSGGLQQQKNNNDNISTIHSKVKRDVIENDTSIRDYALRKEDKNDSTGDQIGFKSTFDESTKMVRLDDLLVDRKKNKNFLSNQYKQDSLVNSFGIGYKISNNATIGNKLNDQQVKGEMRKGNENEVEASLKKNTQNTNNKSNLMNSDSKNNLEEEMRDTIEMNEPLKRKKQDPFDEKY